MSAPKKNDDEWWMGPAVVVLLFTTCTTFASGFIFAARCAWESGAGG